MRPVILTFCALLLAGAAHASIIQAGSNYTIQGVNAPDNFGPTTLVFDGTSKLVDGGKLSVTELQVPTSGGGEWDIFSVSTVGGGPLAGNINAYWSLSWGFTVNGPAYFDATTIWWTANGVAFDPITNFSGICCATTNPINASYGKAYYNSFPPGDLENGFITFNPTIFASPYNIIASGGMNTSTANGFNFAFHYTPAVASVPEPGSLLLLGSGLAFVLRRRNSCRLETAECPIQTKINR